MLEDEGFRILLFDNRDVGLSEKFEGRAYELKDMVDDVAALMDHVRFERAHIAGQSMGGMIAQQFAIDYPDRTLSLTSIYSTPAASLASTDDPEVWDVAGEPPARDRESAIDQYIRRERLSGLDGFSEEWIRGFATAVVDRDWDPEGAQRQMLSLQTSSDRRPGLGKVTVPAAVIHGREDRLIGFEAGIATACAIPGSELHIFPDMGHQIAPAFWPDIVRVFARNRERARCSSGRVG